MSGVFSWWFRLKFELNDDAKQKVQKLFHYLFYLSPFAMPFYYARVIYACSRLFK